MSKIDLKLVDEQFVATSREDATKGALAAAIREGRRRERDAQALDRARAEAMHSGNVAGMKEAQHEELSRLARLIAPKSLYKGLMLGLAASIFTGVMGILGGYWLFERGVTTQVAAQRVPRSELPSLNDSYREAELPGSE